MKKTLILLSLCFSMNLYADFETGLALGLIMSPSSDNVTVVKDEFTTQIEIIERGIPNSFNDENPKLEYIAYVDEVSKDRYLNYFKNKGYQVNYNKGKITFDLTKHFEYFKKSQETNKKILVYFFYTLGIVVVAALLRFLMEILFISHGVYGTNEFEKITKLALILTGKIKRVNLNDKNDTK